MPGWAQFLGVRTRAELDRQVFALLWQEWGYGVNLSYADILALPVSTFENFLRLRYEHMERAANPKEG